MGPGPEYSKARNINSSRMKHTVLALNARQLLNCYRNGHIEEFPRVSANQIEKMAQGDTFVKILALDQVLSLIVQLISRQVSSLRRLRSLRWLLRSLAWLRTFCIGVFLETFGV